MKKTLFSSIIGFTALISTAVPSFGQGKINLNNYSGSGNQITYGFGWAPSIVGTGLQNGSPGGVTWSVGFYYALGDVTGSVSPDPTGVKNPSTLGGGLALATGAAGDTTVIQTGLPGGGYFQTTADAIINGWTAGSVTFEVIVYSGADYFSSQYRAHSAPFLLTPTVANAPQAAPLISSSSGGMPGFSVPIIPEPTTFALSGIGSAIFLVFRRRLRVG
jgi:hypothetical protein